MYIRNNVCLYKHINDSIHESSLIIIFIMYLITLLFTFSILNT